MIVEFNIDMENGVAQIVEETEYGTQKKKKMALDEFLQIYISCIKEKEDNYEFLFLPPGTIEYRKNMNSISFCVETYPYKKFYGVEDKDCDYFIVMNTDLNITKIISYKVYATKGAFNKYFSVFSKIYESDLSFEIADECDGIQKCIKSCGEIPLQHINFDLRYKNII